MWLMSTLMGLRFLGISHSLRFVVLYSSSQKVHLVDFLLDWPALKLNACTSHITASPIEGLSALKNQMESIFFFFVA